MGQLYSAKISQYNTAPNNLAHLLFVTLGEVSKLVTILYVFDNPIIVIKFLTIKAKN